MEQIIKFKWKNWKPVLVLTKSEIALFDNDINIAIGELYCTGFKKNNKHFPCPKNERLEEGWQCSSCARMDDFSRCVRCDGSTCSNAEKRCECIQNDYYIYLAAFGSLLKVGMSHDWRSLQRFVEQGADFAARVAHVKDGKIARKLEQHVKQTLNAIDRVKGDQKFDQLFKDPCMAVKNINNAIMLLHKANVNYLIEPEIEDLRSYYRLDKVRTNPAKLEITSGSVISGRTVACKGNLIFLEKDDQIFTINAHRLVGRMITNVTNDEKHLSIADNSYVGVEVASL